MELTVAQLAERLDAKLIGEGSARVKTVQTIAAADELSVTFITDEKHITGLKGSLAAAVITERQISDLDNPQLLVKNAQAALIETMKVFAPEPDLPPAGINPSAIVSPEAKVDASARIGAHVTIAAGVEIGPDTVLCDGCKIGRDTRIGRNCRIDYNVVIYCGCVIGDNVIIQANTTIGSTGFGYHLIDGAHRLIPHNGGVVIEDDVEIGANCCIDRGKFGNTRIGAGTKIDNLVQIAHNVQTGRNCLLTGQTGIAGSTKIGEGVVLAGGAGIADNIEVGDRSTIGTMSVLTHNVGADKVVFGIPAGDIQIVMKSIALSRRLPKLFKQVKDLDKRIGRVEAAEDDKK